MKMTKEIKVNIKVDVKLTLWSAIKLRIAGKSIDEIDKFIKAIKRDFK